MTRVAGRRRLIMTRSALRAVVVAAVASVVLMPGVALAGPQDPAPTEVTDVVCAFGDRLDLILGEFDQQIGPFDDGRLNRSLIMARRKVVDAQEDLTSLDATPGMRDLRAAMGFLERGADLMVTGSGFADDIASLGSFYAEQFAGELIGAASSSGAIDNQDLDEATSFFQEGMLFRDAGEWEQALSSFTSAVRTLEHNWTTDTGCT